MTPSLRSIPWVSGEPGVSLARMISLGCSIPHLPSCMPFSLPDVAALGSVVENEDALLRHLFQGYQKWVRPVENSNDTIKVLFGLKISQLVDVVSAVSSSIKHCFSCGEPCALLWRRLCCWPWPPDTTSTGQATKHCQVWCQGGTTSCPGAPWSPSKPEGPLLPAGPIIKALSHQTAFAR